MSDFTPADQKCREQIKTNIGETLFVEAGAGTGKSTSLVGRIVTLVQAGHDVSKIAAITFTEAAAAELRDKVRRKLEEEASSSGNPIFHEAVRSLDSASIQTLHSFAGSLLREKPLEAGVPPGFEVVVDFESKINFDEKWNRWLDEVINSTDISQFLIKSIKLGLSLDKLKEVGRDFHENYDLLPLEFSPFEFDSSGCAERFVKAVTGVGDILSCSRNGEADPLYNHCQGLIKTARRMQRAGFGTEAALITLSQIKKISFTGGKQGDWDVIPGTKNNACKDIKETLKSLSDTISSELELTRRAALMPLLESLRVLVVNYTAERKREGKAEFQDLLVWARDLLKDNCVIRRHFQQKFSHILIDEFQDTDPIQAEIAFYLSEDVSRPEDCQSEWEKIRLVPGKLFVVGDPKQSIYRFRRADIITVEQVKALILAQNADGFVPLSQNFRSQKRVIDWVNAVFEVCMQDNETGTQACYIPLKACFVTASGTLPKCVHWLGKALEARMPQIRREEASDVTRTISLMKINPWQVRDEQSFTLRPARYRDICILMPTRTGLQVLERALDSEGIPYRVESQSMILGTQDVRELISCLRAIDAPADQIALVAALRSSAFAISDVELLEFIENGGKLNFTTPRTAGGPVKEALDLLAKYHENCLWLPPAQLIENFVRDRKMEEVCFGRARPRERLRRLQFVIEKARTFSELKESSLRGFLDWIESLAEENARMVEVPVPESDEDAVRIMTIHASKGLEFPVTILMGLGSKSPNLSEDVIFDVREKDIEVCVGSSSGPRFFTEGYDAACESEKIADEAENIRLMYVAATRAKDHLVVSLYRKKLKNDEKDKSFARRLEDVCSQSSDIWETVGFDDPAQQPLSVEQPKFEGTAENDTEQEREAWIKRREQVLAIATKPASLAVTAITRVNKEESADEYPLRLGRGGTNLGRAVHSVLQSVDLTTEKGLNDIVKAQTANEGIPNRFGEALRLVNNALDSKVMKRAVASDHFYREVFVSLPISGTLIEGFVDLIFEEDGGLVIADYKTDAVDEDPSENKLAQYSLQAGIYALAVNKIAGKPVKEVVLLFLSKPVELVFKDITSLMEKAQQAIAVYPQPIA